MASENEVFLIKLFVDDESTSSRLGTHSEFYDGEVIFRDLEKY